MKLSILITALNEFWKEIDDTIESIRKTAGDVEIILVDDCSSTPVKTSDRSVRIIQNRWRCGVGPSRTIAAYHATGTHLLITDAHMRFIPGWYERALKRIEGRPKTLHCACCAAIDTQHMDPLHPVGYYHGGSINVYGKDKNNPALTQVFEPVWNEKEPSDDDPLACVMGAGYFIFRDWFFHLDPLKHLRSWGEDELLLSVKSWLAGGDVRYMKYVAIGHRFRLKNERTPWDITLGHRSWNKLFAVHTLLDTELAEAIHNKIGLALNGPELSAGLDLLKRDWHLVQAERLRNQRIFKLPFGWLAKKFRLAIG